MSGFNASARREDVSFKLRAQDMAINMKHTRDQTKKLETESRKMEERLKELKTAMSREKEERERQGGGFWGRGQSNTGSLTGYASEVLHAKPEKPIKEGKKKKIKVLQDEPIELPQRSSQPGTVKYIAQRKLTSGSTPRDKQKGPKCGQCEDRSATLSCVQCSEIYCAGCFAAFHLKGALKQHRSCPISATGGRVCMSPRPCVDASSPRGSQASGSVVNYQKSVYPVDGSEASGPRSSHTTPRQAAGASLLQGDYDESQSAASFQQALMAWRSGDENTSPKSSARKPKPVASPVRSPVVSMDTSTGTTEEVEMPDIKFTGSLSYVEKLMLKKHRRTELDECSTPRLTDQSGLSSRLSGRSEFSSRQSHRWERTTERDTASPSPKTRNVYSGKHRRSIDDMVDGREKSFIDDGERVDFQSLYEAVVSTEGSNINTPRSDFSMVDVSNSPNFMETKSHKPSVKASAPHVIQPVSSFESWTIEERQRREEEENFMLDSSLLDKYSSKKPSGRATVEEMFPSELQLNNEPTLTAMDTTPSSLLNNNLDDNDMSKTRKTKRKSSAEGKENDILSSVTSSSHMNETESQAEKSPSKSSKSRPTSAYQPKSSKSRPASRAQSRAASRMMMAEGLLTKTPSKALSEVANLANDASMANVAPYQSPLEGFFLAGVDLAGLPQQTNEERTITPRKPLPSSSSSLLNDSSRPKSRSGRNALKSATGDRETIKVSNRLYQMAPRSWRPDSSLGETIPLQDIQVDGESESDMVLSYSYSGHMTGRATEWRPSSSQSSIAQNPSDDLDLHSYGKSDEITDKEFGQGDSWPHQEVTSSSAPSPLPQPPHTANTPRNKSANRRSLGASTPATPKIPLRPNHSRESPSINSYHQKSSSSLSNIDNQNDSFNYKMEPSENVHHSISKSKNKASHLVDNLLPSKSEIPFTRSKTKTNPSNQDSLSRSNTQTFGVMKNGRVHSDEPSRPSSKASVNSSLSRRHSNIDHQRPNSSTVYRSDITQGRRTPHDSNKDQRPNSTTGLNDRSGKKLVTKSQSLDKAGREDSIIADVMSTRVNEDGWMAGDDDADDDGIVGDYDDSQTMTEMHGKSDNSHWETEVRPFTRESLDSAKVRGRQQYDQNNEEREYNTRPSSTMSGRESRAIVMDGEDLSAYDTVLDHEERNEDDNQALEQLEWELASDTGRLTADGQISRLGISDQDQYFESHSTSRSSSSKSIRFSIDKEYDLNSKLLEDEQLAERDFDDFNLDRSMTLDEDEVKALR